jgi:hypothetical protein
MLACLITQRGGTEHCSPARARVRASRVRVLDVDPRAPADSPRSGDHLITADLDAFVLDELGKWTHLGPIRAAELSEHARSVLAAR